MKSLKWSQVNAWRLAQHCLSPHLARPDHVQAVTRTGGFQAQVMSAAELAMGARVNGLTPLDVQAALWQDRTLIKTWAMRATLHLIASHDFPLYVAARSIDEPRNWVGYFNYFGITQAQFEAYLAIAPEILGSEPMTKEQFAAALSDRIGSAELRSLVLTKGWGTPLKPLAWRGELCFGPNQGLKVTFVRPSQWIGSWQPVEPYGALQEMARRYLRAFGPATVEEFAGWWGLRLTPARKLFRSLEEEIEPVEVEGWSALVLRENLTPLQNLELTGSVNLLPVFDAYVMGIGRGQDIEPILPRAYQSQVYRPQGWISAVVLVDGVMKGIWESKTQRKQTLLKVRLFSSPTTKILQGIEAEVQRLSDFFNSKVLLEVEAK
jgi:hypothetical protein